MILGSNISFLISMRYLCFSIACFLPVDLVNRASQDMALNSDNVTECKATKPVPNCGVFSWAFTQTPLAVAPPFLRPFNSKPSNNYVCPNPNTILRDIQTSIMSTTDKCFKLLHLFASENPVLKKLLSWSSEFHTIRKQVRNSPSLLFTTYSFGVSIGKNVGILIVD